MKPIAIFVLVAAISLATVAASAKVVTQQADNERVVNAVAGPAPGKSKAADASQPTRKELRRSKVKAKPPLNDPN